MLDQRQSRQDHSSAQGGGTIRRVDGDPLPAITVSHKLAEEVLSSLNCMTALVRLKYGNLDPDVNVALEAAHVALSRFNARIEGAR